MRLLDNAQNLAHDWRTTSKRSLCADLLLPRSFYQALPLEIFGAVPSLPIQARRKHSKVGPADDRGASLLNSRGIRLVHGTRGPLALRGIVHAMTGKRMTGRGPVP